MSADRHGLAHLAFCATGICVAFLYYGVILEKSFSGEEKLGATFVLVTQCVTNTFVAIIWKKISDRMVSDRAGDSSSKAKHKEDLKKNQLPVHHWLLFLTSAVYVCAMGFSNEAIQYVSYPVAVLAKSCKLIPCMLMGQIVEGKMHSKQEWMAALSISLGIAIFHLSRIKNTDKGQGGVDYFTYGMTLLVASLFMDGFLSSCQNFLKRERIHVRPPSAVETMYYVNLYSLMFLVPVSVANGQWQHGFMLITTRPGWIHKTLALNASAAIGQIFIFLTITWYTPVVTTTITTLRKFFTIILSVIKFGHSFSFTQWGAICLVFLGLTLVIQIQREKTRKLE